MDLQNDPSLLARVNFTVHYDGILDSTVFSWNPSQDVIWPTKKIGTVGIDDLGSMSGVASYNGYDIYTFKGFVPSGVWAQPIGGSPTVDGTDMSLAAELYISANEFVGKEDTNPTQVIAYNNSGLAIVWTNQPPDMKLPHVIVGERINLRANWIGVNPPAANATVTWTLEAGGEPIKGFYVQYDANEQPAKGGWEPVSTTPILFSKQDGHNAFSFVWTNGSFDGKLNEVTVKLDSPGRGSQSLTGKMQVFRPNADIAVQVGNNPDHTVTSVSDRNDKNVPRISFGELTPSGKAKLGEAGIEFDAYAEEPAPWHDGSYQWIQIITSESVVLGRKTVSAGPGLDLSYDYGSITARNALVHPPQAGEKEVTDTSDSPSIFSDKSYFRDEIHAQMILQYKPSEAGDNDWVALEFVSWSWTGEYKEGTASFSHDPTNNGVYGKPTYLDPKWDKRLVPSVLFGEVSK